MRVYRTRWRGLVCFDSSRFLARVMSQKRLLINILYIDVYNFRWYSNWCDEASSDVWLLLRCKYKGPPARGVMD